MCKILGISNFSELNKKSDISPMRMIELCKEIVTKHNHDGFGFGINSSDKIYTYHQLDTDAPISDKKINYNESIFDLESMGQKTTIKSISNAFLMKSDLAIFHGRTSTNLDGIEYCHPFESENDCLVHNGVIHLEDPDFSKIEDKLKTENDTEQLFELWKIHGLKTIEKLFGYYAFYNIKRTKKGNYIEVVRDDTAEQYAVKIDSVYIFGTTRDMIEDFLKGIGLNNYLPYIVAMNDNVYFKVDAQGAIFDHVKIEPNSDSIKLSKKEKRAFKDYASDEFYNEVDEIKGTYLDETYSELSKNYKAS